MTKVFRFTFALLCCFQAVVCFSQEMFTNCTAAFLDDRIVVDAYTPEGRCIIAENATGMLTVWTADLSPTQSIAKDKVRFMIAIRDKNTGTLVMYSEDVYKKIDIRKVLAKCQKGDRIVLLTLDREYALPHNEILLN